MLIVKLEECPDNLISYQFRVQSRLPLRNKLYIFGWRYSESKMRLSQKEKLFYHLHVFKK